MEGKIMMLLGGGECYHNGIKYPGLPIGLSKSLPHPPWALLHCMVAIWKLCCFFKIRIMSITSSRISGALILAYDHQKE
jgi:hypothetical protein